MTATTSQPVAQAPSTSSDRRVSATAGILSYAVGAVLTAPEAHDTTEIVVVLSIAGLVALAVFGWLLPQGMAKGAPGTAVALSGVGALLFFPAFWSMLPLLLGVGGAMLGYACIGHAPKRAYAAMGLGGITAVGFLYLYIVVGVIMDAL